MNLLPKLLPRNTADRQADLERSLLRAEAKIGGQIFGPVPAGRNRQFFCLDEYTWIWHEEWQANGKRQAVTTRYEVRPNGVLKAQTGKPYQRLSADEARNLYRAVDLYGERVDAYYSQILQTA